MKKQPQVWISGADIYAIAYQAAVIALRVPPRGLKGCAANKRRMALLPRCDVAAKRVLQARGLWPPSGLYLRPTVPADPLPIGLKFGQPPQSSN